MFIHLQGRGCYLINHLSFKGILTVIRIVTVLSHLCNYLHNIVSVFFSYAHSCQLHAKLPIQYNLVYQVIRHNLKFSKLLLFIHGKLELSGYLSYPDLNLLLQGVQISGCTVPLYSDIDAVKYWCSLSWIYTCNGAETFTFYIG